MKIVLRYYMRVVMLLLPISFLPVMSDAYGMGKNWLLMAMAVVGMVIWLGGLLLSKEKMVKVSRMWWLMGAMVMLAWVGWWFKLAIGVRTRVLFDFGGIGTLTAWWLWLFLWIQTASDRDAQIKWLTGSGLLAGLVSIVVFLFPASKLPIVWPKDSPILNIGSSWAMTGSLLDELILLSLLVIEWGKRLIDKLKKDDSYLTEAIVASLLTLILLVDIFRQYRLGWVSLGNSSSWIIAVESFKQNPLWGVGIGNYSQAFMQFRPVGYNLSSFWSNGFRVASMGIFQLWTELGISGLILAGLMVWQVWKQKKDFQIIRTIIVGIAVALLPYTMVGMWLLGWCLAEIDLRKNIIKLELMMGEKKYNFGPWLVAMLVLIMFGGSGYEMYRGLMGEIFMKQSLVAATKNDGGTTYNLQIKAIGMMPSLAEYRRIYSQTNLSLASVILSKKDMNDEEKQKASVLIQQSVREAKAAIALENNNAGYWSNLATIYRQIIGIVDGSADWSLQAYQQALALDPVNPIVRLDMGGLLFAGGKYDEADRVFEATVVSKNDFPNAWYNWAHSGKKINKLPEAISRLTQALALVPVDSGDFDKASKELEEWKKELEVINAKAKANQEQVKEKFPETLETAQPLPTGSKTGVIPVPTGELNPPSMSISPTAIPSVKP